jgi:hypothetical protein
MLGGIAGLKCKLVKNAGQRMEALFIGVENFCILASNLCKNG